MTKSRGLRGGGPPCPSCGSTKARRYHGDRDLPATMRRYYACTCGHRFVTAERVLHLTDKQTPTPPPTQDLPPPWRTELEEALKES